MAATADSADKERARPGGAVPAHLSGHHRAQAANRDGRHQGRPVEIRQAREIGHQVAIGPRVAVQLTPASHKGLGHANRHGQADALGTCKYYYYILHFLLF